MGRLWGSFLVIIGTGLWYYGGARGSVALVNLGIGTIILGIVLMGLPSRGYVSKEALLLSCRDPCGFIEDLKRDLELEGPPVVIPPYENLPKGGLFFPKAEGFSLRLGKFIEGSIFVTGTEVESGILLSPPPGWAIVEYTIENSDGLSGTGVGYASSAISSTLSALGIGSGEAFEREDGKVEVFVRPLCRGSPYGDPAVSAMLLGIAMGKGEVLEVESLEKVKDYVKLVLEPLGGVEKWL
ncbi:hypothetical protein [Thermococcus sp.]|uniref:hypothetical protein n=1 Tax=Thermococcus sp. TaxID=35749 RepID=UPI002636038B|nr:hypothetical protein [Thermococcus sp.]